MSHLPWPDQSATDCGPALLRLKAEDVGCDMAAVTSSGLNRQQNITATDHIHQGASSSHFDYDTADPLVCIFVVICVNCVDLFLLLFEAVCIRDYLRLKY